MPNFGLNNLLKPNLEPNWEKIDQLPLFANLYDCGQDAQYHAEGNVGIHTRMVVEALLALPEWQALSQTNRYVLFLSALLHDIAKPLCTSIQDGRIVSPRHAKVGEKMVREWLWDANFDLRETICSLVRLHGLPLWVLEKSNPHAAVIASSLRVPNHWVALLAKADVLGRTCHDQNELLERIGFFEEFCRENECYEQPKLFENSHSRFKYFYTNATYPAVLYDDTRFKVVLMSGIAGAGKDTYIQTHYPHLPVVSLDDLRRQMKVKYGDEKGQGLVIQQAKKLAKTYAAHRQSFVWNSTNLTKDMRSRLIALLEVYNPQFEVVYIETSMDNIVQRRKGDIPQNALYKMQRSLDMPQLDEAHEVIYNRNG